MTGIYKVAHDGGCYSLWDFISLAYRYDVLPTFTGFSTGFRRASPQEGDWPPKGLLFSGAVVNRWWP